MLIIATALAIYNATLLDFDHLLSENSSIALYSIIGCAIAVVLLTILLLSYKIKEKTKRS